MTWRVATALALLLAALTGAQWLWAPPHHPTQAWHHWPGFLALLGLGACLGVAWLSKQLGKRLLQRPENHDA